MENMRLFRSQIGVGHSSRRWERIVTGDVVRIANSFIFIVAICAWHSVSTSAADRTTLLIPLAEQIAGELPENAVFADEAFGAPPIDGWSAYVQLWKSHHNDPRNSVIRRYLGLPLKGKIEIKKRRGRSAPRWLAWPAGSYDQFDTPHFVLYSRADDEASRRVAEDLERCYWVWTQLFFPLWEARHQVAATFADWQPDQSIVETLQDQSDRLSTSRKLRIVLFRDAAEYQQTINVPGVERSTGFYSDEKRTTFLYAADADDAATRRHELVHQLFRESTHSQLRRKMPAEQSGFWLIEGIAGYFESLYVGEDYATVGGWDSPRLQFARHRFFIGGDRMPMSELRQDGRLSAQQRTDVARWYAHAITQTHLLLDAGNIADRRWIYHRLAELYHVEADSLDLGSEPDDSDATLNFLSIGDADLAQNPTQRSLAHLCLAGCPVTPDGLNHIRPTADLQRLTLVGKGIDVAAVQRLIVNPSSLQQLSLERTGIGSDIADLLEDATNLRELDLSSTIVDDSVTRSISKAMRLTTLWMTGTRLTDQSIDAIAKLPALENVDLQQTGVTAAGIKRLKELKPNLTVNPLEIQGLQ